MRAILLMLALLVSGACGDAPEGLAAEIELAATATTSPRLVLPRNAAWQPRWQQLRSRLSVQAGEEMAWACYSGSDFEAVEAFYRRQFGAAPERRDQPLDEWLALVAGLSTELGLPIPTEPESGRLHRAQWPATEERAAVLVESPYPHARTGRLSHGALICLSWAER